MRVCIFWKLGTICHTITPIAVAITGTTTATSQARPTSSRSAITMPPTIMIGAITITVPPISTTSWTCCTSLVSRVISDGAPNCCPSRAENSPTRRKIAARRSRPNPIAVRAANHTRSSEASPGSSAAANITPRRRQMSQMSPATTPLSMISALRLGRNSIATVAQNCRARIASRFEV